MTKLRLKRTPAEKEERARRKAYKAARKRSRQDQKHAEEEHDSSDSGGGRFTGAPNSKKRRTGDASSSYFDDEDYGPPPPPASSSYKPDYDAIRAEMEEMRFREKMCEALEDDERLDGINSRFNDYAHIPERWGRSHSKHDKHDTLDPQDMDDVEYAEWIREGMWRKKHAREYEEQAQRQAAQAAQKAHEKQIKAETARLEKAASQREERRRMDRQMRRKEEYRQIYEQRWKELLDPLAQEDPLLTFADIPWPLFTGQPLSSHRSSSDHVLTLTVEEITAEAVSAFLLSDIDSLLPTTPNSSEIKRDRDKLKETLLRFHPDKFEGRLMRRVLAGDKDRVKEAVGQVARVLNILMKGKS
ncbi:hypothetical protein PAXRUDRAFT_142661 [Paxillus rubicundulus Ve08.2h10]|uniref:Uncharacterized protein n=1 Tax=Paxillus rubicundulus Ve08.2h10 TaxID=930991 RepID=A0A0D0DX11_9AGAM|nr:hypothetical protein PAXRUDRAFT_142661 [Paxillus rubicundulus Ve08.2h10]